MLPRTDFRDTNRSALNTHICTHFENIAATYQSPVQIDRMAIGDRPYNQYLIRRNKGQW